jgi:hypothetical protein
MLHNTQAWRFLSVGAAALWLLVLGGGGEGQTGGRVKVTITDKNVVTGEPTLPIDPTPRAVARHSGNFAFGIKVDNKRITCSEQGSIWCLMRVDGQETNLGFGVPVQKPPQPLPAGPNGKARVGFETTWSDNNVRVTQTVELVPSRPAGKTLGNSKRRMDTYRVSYVVENIAKDGRARKVEFKACIDMLINLNDGALYASPTTHPGKVLNGMTLKGKDLPEYALALERPDANNPGFTGVLTFKQNKGDNPNCFVMTTLGSVHQNWEPPAMQAGDSACALLWDAKEIKPGEKREMVWAYGGGIAVNPEAEGRVSLALGGSFEPNKLFTITAHVDNPVSNQALALELPDGMERVEGREIQPVPPPGDAGSSIVLWKARVLRTGDHELKVRSSTGVTQIKNISIQAQ